MKKELAEYILCLSDTLTNTKQANDRQLYEKYLADAAVLLALVELNTVNDELKQKVDTHERLLSNTWVTSNDEYEIFYEAWSKFKNQLE
jgi:hypothetical protein